MPPFGRKEIMLQRQTKFSTTIVLVLAFFCAASVLTSAQESTSQGPQEMGPVGQEEAKPAQVIRPVNSVVDPGIIPSRQGITPAGLQSVFESRGNGVVFNEDGNSIYAATLGQNSSHIFQIDLQTNRVSAIIESPITAGMQGLVYDAVAHSPVMSGLSGGKK